MYTAGHASTAYDGVYFGERRDPKRKWHSKATKEWVKVFTDDNQESGELQALTPVIILTALPIHRLGAVLQQR